MGIEVLSGVELKNRLTKGCYYIINLLLCEVSLCLSLVMFVDIYFIIQKSYRISVIVQLVLWILPAILHTAFGSFNHMCLIYCTINEVSKICHYFLTVTMFFALAKCKSMIISEGIQSFESHQHFKILTFQCFRNG